MLIDNQHNFDMCMKLENKGFAKHLKKIFDKKLKIPKIKSHDADGNLYDYLFFIFSIVSLPV